MVELKTILLVEDSPNDVELTLEALGEHGLINRVVTVNDGVEAMDYLLCRDKFTDRVPINPAVILLDIKMPRMNGIEVLEAIRKNDKLKTIPVVILTSSREEPDLVKCYDLGVNAYVVKPVDFSQFIEAVRQVGIFWALINELPPQK